VRQWLDKYPDWLFIAGNIGLTLLIFVPGWLLHADPAVLLPFMLIAVYSPLLFAVIITQLREGEGGLVRLFGKFAIWRVGWWWYVIALFMFPALALIAHGIRYVLDGTVLHPGGGGSIWYQLAFGVFIFLIVGTAEELGWRGFLQPRLQRRIGALAATLVVGVTWGIWHGRDIVMHPELFAHVSYGYKFLWILGASVLVGWICNNTQGSALLATVAHFGGNLMAAWCSVFPGFENDLKTFWIYMAVLVVVIIVIVTVQGAATLAGGKPLEPPSPEEGPAEGHSIM
jgi:membrane protease YdiL (CAAX protease family)